MTEETSIAIAETIADDEYPLFSFVEYYMPWTRGQNFITRFQKTIVCPVVRSLSGFDDIFNAIYRHDLAKTREVPSCFISYYEGALTFSTEEKFIPESIGKILVDTKFPVSISLPFTIETPSFSSSNDIVGVGIIDYNASAGTYEVLLPRP